jgi:hypothetical protein
MSRARSVKPCYNAYLAAGGTHEGHLVVKTVVGPDGNVCGNVDVSDDGFGSSEFIECVVRLARTALPPPSGGCIRVTVPYAFSARPADAAAD